MEAPWDMGIPKKMPALLFKADPEGNLTKGGLFLPGTAAHGADDPGTGSAAVTAFYSFRAATASAAVS